MIKKLKIDEEFKDLIPPLTTEEFNQLESNIIKEGVRDKIITWRGVIIDGHNRYKICKKNDIEFKTKELELADRYEVINWIVNNQLGRRNLLPEQKQYLIHKMYENEKKDKLDNLKQNSPKYNSCTSDEPTDKVVSKRMKVSEQTVHNAHKFGKAVDKLNESGLDRNDILSGNIDITQKDVVKLGSFKNKKLKKIIKMLKDEEADSVKHAELLIERQKNEIKNEIKDNKPIIYKQSYIDWLQTIKECDLLLTDPPYMTDLEDGQNIDKFADEWLIEALSKVKSTGHAYVFIGAYPEELRAYLNVFHNRRKETKLTLENVLVWSYRNTLGVAPSDKYILNWQSVLYFKGVDAGDLYGINKVEKFAVQDISAPDARTGYRYHTWQKPDEIADRFIRHSTKENDLVIDPFAGTGTFVLSANRLGRIGVGCEISKKMRIIAKKRGCKIVK